MKKWMLKAIIQKVITYLPFSFHLNYFFQKYITRSVHLSDDFFDIMLDHFKEMTDYLSKYDFKVKDKDILELGTGWHPIMPILLFLNGAKSIKTIDLRSHFRKENLKALLEKSIRYHKEEIFKQKGIFIDTERIATLQKVLNMLDQQPIETSLENCHIIQSIQDATKLQEPDEEFDLCYSVNVLEHIYTAAVEPIAKQLHRVNKTGGFQYHAIGVYDHFVHVDQSISKFNYLKYSEKKWKQIDNGIQPQNRKRISYFRNLYLRIGFKIKDEILWEAEPIEIEKITLHPDFVDAIDIAIPYGTFILEK